VLQSLARIVVMTNFNHHENGQNDAKKQRERPTGRSVGNGHGLMLSSYHYTCKAAVDNVLHDNHLISCEGNAGCRAWPAAKVSKGPRSANALALVLYIPTQSQLSDEPGFDLAGALA
jgi:hypothetical protein